MKPLHQDKIGVQARSTADPGGVPAWKRLLDVLCIFAAMPLVLSLGLLVALAIKTVSPGPVMFTQTRVGYLRRRFQILKFRTMAVDADTGAHQAHLNGLMNSDRPMTKLDAADSRLIPFGSWLRTSGIDELPQLINILRGEMSLVGPRPCLPYECDKYLPRHYQRFETLPGLTGLWQVNGKNRTTFEEMIDLDIQYVQEKSPRLDLKIILKTIPAIIVQINDTRRIKKSVHQGPVTDAANADQSVEQSF